MGTRNFQIFVVRYVGDIVRGNSVVIAVCMNEIAGGDNPFLGCEHTRGWGELEALFPDADIDLLKRWCEALRNDFCSPDTNPLVQEALKNCSTNIDVSVSRITLDATDDPGGEMKKLFHAYSRSR
jgi:hypothetical protein